MTPPKAAPAQFTNTGSTGYHAGIWGHSVLPPNAVTLQGLSLHGDVAQKAVWVIKEIRRVIAGQPGTCHHLHLRGKA